MTGPGEYFPNFPEDAFDGWAHAADDEAPGEVLDGIELGNILRQEMVAHEVDHPISRPLFSADYEELRIAREELGLPEDKDDTDGM